MTVASLSEATPLQTGLQAMAKKSGNNAGPGMAFGFIAKIRTKRIYQSRNQLRDDLGSLDDLVTSIKDRGLLQPIIVRPLKDGFEVVAGNRRLEACRTLGIREVPCYVVDLDDQQSYEVSLVENIQRSSLNPIEEAKAFMRYVDEFGYGGVSNLARRIGKSVPYVSKRITLLGLPKDIQEQVFRGGIVPSVAEELMYLDQDEAAEVAAKLVAGRVTRSEVRSMVRKLKTGGINQPAELHRYRDAEESLRRVERAMSKCTASLKVCLMQVDETVESLGENEWFIKESLFELRRTLHQSIDGVIRLRERAKHRPELLTPGLNDRPRHDSQEPSTTVE